MERQKNWDPGVKRFFLRILNSIAWGLLWIMTAVMAGIYYELGFIHKNPVLQTIIFYVFMAVTLFILVRYLIRKWRNED